MVSWLLHTSLLSNIERSDGLGGCKRRPVPPAVKLFFMKWLDAYSEGQQPKSTKEMAKALGVSDKACSSAFRMLISNGYVERVAEGTGGVGRPKYIYRPARKTMIAVDGYANKCSLYWGEQIKDFFRDIGGDPPGLCVFYMTLLAHADKAGFVSGVGCRRLCHLVGVTRQSLGVYEKALIKRKLIRSIVPAFAGGGLVKKLDKVYLLDFEWSFKRRGSGRAVEIRYPMFGAEWINHAQQLIEGLCGGSKFILHTPSLSRAMLNFSVDDGLVFSGLPDNERVRLIEALQPRLLVYACWMIRYHPELIGMHDDKIKKCQDLESKIHRELLGNYTGAMAESASMIVGAIRVSANMIARLVLLPLRLARFPGKERTIYQEITVNSGCVQIVNDRNEADEIVIRALMPGVSYDLDNEYRVYDEMNGAYLFVRSLSDDGCNK